MTRYDNVSNSQLGTLDISQGRNIEKVSKYDVRWLLKRNAGRIRLRGDKFGKVMLWISWSIEGLGIHHDVLLHRTRQRRVNREQRV